MTLARSEDKLQRDNELLSTFRTRVMGGEDCHVSPKDMVQYWGQSIDAAGKQLTAPLAQVEQRQVFWLKGSTRASGDGV